MKTKTARESLRSRANQPESSFKESFQDELPSDGLRRTPRFLLTTFLVLCVILEGWIADAKGVWLQEREAVDEAAAPLAEAVEDGEVVHSHRQVRRGLEGVVTQVVTMEDGEEDGGRIHKLCQFRTFFVIVAFVVFLVCIIIACSQFEEEEDKKKRERQHLLATEAQPQQVVIQPVQQ
ncbi:hypothetical protein PRIPAC_88661 [Pristionchus pacificus]|uniref:Uncharacterized protein n=1 Tax=Pristionchus pacificus TaxID=54126 RepID=A0A2A6B6N1_PRIPA|nr:hypothetical protein PRIPAC_88661 [Pristionchus pacificus]|eukprot:PDM61540.1 hypothetical protein PRIPAC_50982 [Pristionchus pacificus]